MQKIGFVTCVQLGLSCIEEIYRIGGNLELLLTLEDEKGRDKSGRIYLDEFAKNHRIRLLKIRNINEKKVSETVKTMKLDWLFIIGWSQIAGNEILKAPSQGCIGIHPTLLPKGRGRASIPWAILKGLPETGVTLFKLGEGVDTGDIIGQIRIPLDKNITATSLYTIVNQAHIELISKYWGDIIEGRVKPEKQKEEEATIWPGRSPEDGEIKKEMTLQHALTLIRAVTHPYPGAFIIINHKKWIIWTAKESTSSTEIQLKDGYIEPIEFEVKDV